MNSRMSTRFRSTARWLCVGALLLLSANVLWAWIAVDKLFVWQCADCAARIEVVPRIPGWKRIRVEEPYPQHPHRWELVRWFYRPWKVWTLLSRYATPAPSLASSLDGARFDRTTPVAILTRIAECDDELSAAARTALDEARRSGQPGTSGNAPDAAGAGTDRK